MIGVLIFNKRIYHKRCGRTKYEFVNNGLKKILSELNQPWEICTRQTINNYSDVICSINSHYDVLNIINNVPRFRKVRVHIGGQACNNIRPIIPYIDTANFGRCDLGKINNILQGDKIKSVWRRADDPEFEDNYIVDQSSSEGLGPKEQSFGCKKKCLFCHYSWWNGYAERNQSGSYQSGFANNEDYFQNLDWSKCIRGAVTALDGCTEETRHKINKHITRDDIKDTLLRSNDLDTKTRLRLKVYCIVGYPWETQLEIDRLDLIDVIKEISNKIRNKITIRMHFSHFIPYQKTPLWEVPFNPNNYRKYCINKYILYSNDNIQVWSSWKYTASPATAAQATVIQRAGNQDTQHIETFATKAFQRMVSEKQLSFITRTMPGMLSGQVSESIPNIQNG